MANFRLNIRKMERNDIPFIIEWSKNKNHIKHFHMPLPSNAESGNQWFQRLLIDKTRDDYVIGITDEDGNKKPIGLIGLCNIDEINKKCEYYVFIGSSEFLRRGIAYRTSAEIISNCFENLDFNKVTAYVDRDHYEAQRLVEKLGFRKEGILADDIILDDNTFTDRYVYGILSSAKK